MNKTELMQAIIQKQDEYNTYLKDWLGLNGITWDISAGARADYEKELASLRQQLEEVQEDKSGIDELIPDTSKNAKQYHGRPKPFTVNPYDGRAILRKLKSR